MQINEEELKILLPKKDKKTGKQMVSYSQLSCYKESFRNYVRRYFFTEKFTGNYYTDFGNKVGTALEKDDYSAFTKPEQTTLKKVTRYDDFERRIEWHFEEFFVLGFIDTSTSIPTKIGDYKTGDPDKVTIKYESEGYQQLEIYSRAIEQETGKLPEEAHVFIIERIGNPYKEDLKVGKRIVVVTKNITPERIEEVKQEVLKIVKEISDYYKVFLKLP